MELEGGRPFFISQRRQPGKGHGWVWIFLVPLDKNSNQLVVVVVVVVVVLLRNHSMKNWGPFSLHGLPPG